MAITVTMGTLSLLNGRSTAAQSVVRKRVTCAASLDATNAWNLHGGNGQVYNTGTKHYSRAVRAVVAF